MAREGGNNYSLPTGVTTLERFKVGDDEKEKCVICLEEFNSGDDAVIKLPCSHICHFPCILQWFDQNGTCPVCRFACGGNHVKDQTMILGQGT
ncbi:hypothetical protein Fmac_018547 [Flemingia macrophylla]|uniref:RING-type domain-containing protein n=1 Tax=Flemingia macrophylla TaxID=520843 RepID=A0ABD1M5D1_9FABA